MKHESNPISRFLKNFLHNSEVQNLNPNTTFPSDAQIDSYRRMQAQNIMNAENAVGFPTGKSQEALQRILTAPSSEIATMMMKESSTTKK